MAFEWLEIGKSLMGIADERIQENQDKLFQVTTFFDGFAIGVFLDSSSLYFY